MRLIQSHLAALAVGSLFTAALVACPTTGPEEPATNMPPPTDEGLARCTTEAEARARVGQVCTVVGTYQLEEFTSQKGEVFRTWPVVVFADGEGMVAVESLWDESKLPDPVELERWRGRTVEVTGKLHASPPSEDRIANLSQLTISPVDTIRLAP
jgi:hypothetical protein